MARTYHHRGLKERRDDGFLHYRLTTYARRADSRRHRYLDRAAIAAAVDYDDLALPDGAWIKSGRHGP